MMMPDPTPTHHPTSGSNRAANAVLACQCGQCRVTLCDPTIRYRLECLCCDCRQRGLQFASKRPENELPAAIINYERGVDDYYFANAFLIDDASRELLEFSKLRPDAFNTTASAACCGTLLCGTHPVYEGASVSVNADSCRVSVPVVTPIQALLFGCDFPADKYAAVLKRNTAPTLFTVYDQVDHAEMIAFLKAVTAPLAEKYKVSGYVTFEQLCAGKPLTIDNSFFEESRRGKPRATSGGN
jgi:hypothetical protein